MQPSPILTRGLKVLLILLLIAAAAWLELKYELSQLFESSNITVWLQQAGHWAPLLFIALMAIAVVFSPLPSVPLDIVAGLYFGPLLGTIYAATGALIGALIAFTLARFMGRAVLEPLLGGHIHFCSKCSDHLLTKLVFFSRLIPFISFDVVSYGAGLTSMSPLKFSVATFLGMLPLTYLYVSAGPAILDQPIIATGGGIIFVVFMLLLPWLIEKRNLFGLRSIFDQLRNRH